MDRSADKNCTLGTQILKKEEEVAASIPKKVSEVSTG